MCTIRFKFQTFLCCQEKAQHLKNWTNFIGCSVNEVGCIVDQGFKDKMSYRTNIFNRTNICILAQQDQVGCFYLRSCKLEFLSIFFVFNKMSFKNLWKIRFNSSLGGSWAPKAHSPLFSSNNAMCIVYCIFCLVYCVLCIVYCVLCNVYYV